LLYTDPAGLHHFIRSFCFNSMCETIPLSFYQGENVVEISRQLLGKFLFRQTEDGICGGMIVETEAYSGLSDKACHAHGKRTPRTEVMYQSGGRAYVYLCYGIHHLFNIVTNKEGRADAVLIRALEPTKGVALMRHRTQKRHPPTRLASGPGLVGKALALTRADSGKLLNVDIWIEDQGVTEFEQVSSERVGVAYAGEDALLPWRFYIKGNSFVSRY